MSYKSQGLFELSSKFPFGKHKGKSLAATYSGDASAIVWSFMKMLDKSLELIFSKEFYESSDDSDVINAVRLMSGWEGDNERISLENVARLVLAMRDGVEYKYKISPNKIKVEARNADGELDANLSKIGCAIAKEYVTRFFGKVSIYEANDFYRPALLSSPELTDLESEISSVEGNPSYINWCIWKVDGFCLRGSKDEVYGLDELPVFSLDNFRIDAGKIKNNAFKINLVINVEFQKAGKELVATNYKKYGAYINELNTSNYLGDDSGHDDGSDDNGYYDADDDEENIMRGLASGDGDLFGM